MQSGERLGPYVIERELGRGGMGVVYLARDERLGRRVAIKSLPPDVAGSGERGARLAREARALAALNHPCVAAIYDLLDGEGGSKLLVLEYVDGESLRERMDRAGTPSIEEAVAWCADAAAALEAAHAAGIVHRDLKPENIRIRPDGRAKVLDFGLARAAAEGEPAGTVHTDDPTVVGRTLAGAMMGTPGYMAPEQVRGEPADERADVWALGCVLYECLSGRGPFAAAAKMGMLARTLSDEPDWNALPDTTPRGVVEVMRRCLEKDAARRVGSAAEVRAALLDAVGRGRSVVSAAWTIAGGAAARAGADRGIPGNLPVQISSFIGRGEQIERVRALLGGSRLVTLTGTGGCGKTRLALRTAEVMAKAQRDRDTGAQGDGWTPRDGAWLVELAGVTDGALVAAEVARALCVKEEPGKPVAESVAAFLGGREALVILDNCEHLLDACARFAERIVRSCAGVRVLATSREGLGVAGEVTFGVPSLTLPSPRGEDDRAEGGADWEGGESESVLLFVDRARAAASGFGLSGANRAAVEQVCRRLDGIPLAIELAAARVRSMGVSQIAARLDDAFRLLTGGSRTALPRQQTLRATIDWSHSLLSAAERVALRRLSVFAGGWTLEAAEGVCPGGIEADAGADAGVDCSDMLDVLSRLVEKSLVVHEAADADDAGGRYRLLEVVRQYGREELNKAGDGPCVRDRHAAWFVELAERAEPRLRGPRQAEWLARLADEHANLLGAMEWLAASANAEDAGAHVRLAGALWRFWFARGHFSLGRVRLDEALARAAGAGPSRERARALGGAGVLAWKQGDFAEAQRLLDAQLADAQSLDDDEARGNALNNLGLLRHYQGEWKEAERYHAEALAVRRRAGDRLGIATSLGNLGAIASITDRYAAARGLYGEALPLLRELGDLRAAAVTLGNVGLLAMAEGDAAGARGPLEESLAIFRGLGDRGGAASTLVNLGHALTDLGEFERAERAYSRCLRYRRELGEKHGMILALEGFSRLAQRVGGRDGAEQSLVLAGACEASREAIGAPLSESDRKWWDGWIGDAKKEVGEDSAARAWARGRAMGLDGAAEMAGEGGGGLRGAGTGP